MAVRNLLAALIGLLFMLAPLWVHSTHESALLASMIGGGIQTAASLLAFLSKKNGWNSWFNWISLVTGVWFIIYPFAYLSGFAGFAFYLVLAITTVMLNYYTMNEQQ